MRAVIKLCCQTKQAKTPHGWIVQHPSRCNCLPTVLAKHDSSHKASLRPLCLADWHLLQEPNLRLSRGSRIETLRQPPTSTPNHCCFPTLILPTASAMPTSITTTQAAAHTPCCAQVLALVYTCPASQPPCCAPAYGRSILLPRMRKGTPDSPSSLSRPANSRCDSGKRSLSAASTRYTIASTCRAIPHTAVA